MRAVLPGKPQATLQAISTAQWEGRRLVTYISGAALVVLTAADQILQTIYHDDVDELGAVTIDEASGKIATCTPSTIYIYRPYGIEEGALQWSLQCPLALDSATDAIRTLSWGTGEELLVGSGSLTLFATKHAEKSVWSRTLANPVKVAQYSADAGLIASTGCYDPLLKIWRRLSFGADDVRFDATYLSHPAVVTGIHWRRPFDREQVVENILYTFCADHVLRIWAPMDPHGLQILQLWAQVDLQASIQPRIPTPRDAPTPRYACIIDGRDFIAATERAVHGAPPGVTENPALDHLVDVARRNPEVCLVLDERGHMCAWGLENVGSRVRQTDQIFNIAHVEGVHLDWRHPLPASEAYVQLINFCDPAPGGEFTVLAHHFDGRIEWLEARADALFDPSPGPDRLTSVAVWSGHAAAVEKIDRTAFGDALIARTSTHENVVWRQTARKASTTLVKQSEFFESEPIRKMCLLDEGRLVALLHAHHLHLWDTRTATALRLARCPYAVEGQPLCLFSLPVTDASPGVAYLATITSAMKGVAWEVQRGENVVVHGVADEPGAALRIRELNSFDLGTDGDLAFVLPVDPAGSIPSISGLMDVFARDVAVSCSQHGVLKTWTAKVDGPGSVVEWLPTSTVETGVVYPSLGSGSSIRKAALVDAPRTGLTIWDTRGAELEFDQRFREQDLIQDLDWTSTPDGQSILAVGFPHRVLLLSQLRYRYIDAGPAWASIRAISIRDATPHPIGDSVWLGNGSLVIGAGNQMLVYDKTVDRHDPFVTELQLPYHHLSDDLFDVVTYLNGPLPAFHPQFLSQCILQGKLLLVQSILVRLDQSLKFYIDGEHLDSLIGLSPDAFYLPAEEDPHARRPLSDADELEWTEETATHLSEQLTRTRLPHLSSHEQLQLADLVQCCATLETHRRSLDDNACRFLLFFRSHMIRRGAAGGEATPLPWRDIVWALHSGSQDILVDLVWRQFQGKMVWEQARESGMCMWVADVTALRAQVEILARNQYTQTDEKNPVDCSLFYLALRKKNVLVGLWRMAGWHREQRSTQKLLANNFSDPRWKTAALKNAYVLLGRHRFEYAAAFFLLADALKDAVGVCVTHLGDVQLAITIARVYGGDDHPVLHALLEDTMLPQAAVDGNRWLATWAFWMLGRREQAVRALVSPIHTLLASPASPTLHAKSFRANDPALVVLYQQLRQKTLQALRGAARISPRDEWDFVFHHARLYDRMGCDLLALDLVRNWEFLPHPLVERVLQDPIPDPRAMLRRSSLVIADPPRPQLPAEMKSGGVKAPQGFEEPDASSLLDSFGF
ncbi:MAG: regulator of (H+)-ATPase in vacuolar membrane [Thelocarpon superellum]|nr:MAG: regulator of (H+)-ATPase in vacuolar membrane [Thelocarpon superellum]